MTAAAEPLLEMSDIRKAFPGVQALDGVDLTLQAGEVLALLGENGAGKSTLIKILGGAHQPDSGRIQLNGQPARIHSPQDAQRHGISVIYQEFNLVPAMTARENIFLGQERGSILRPQEENRRASELFARIGVQVDPETLCRNLTVAQQQVVEIAKALSLDARIIVMDEPSAALSPREVDGLFAIVRELKSHGIAVIYISHRLNEIFEIADRVTVLRDGAHVDTRPVGELTRATMIELMVGRKLENEFPRRETARDEPTSGLSVKQLRRDGVVNDVSFDVRRGEILALTGLIGAGRTEAARLIFGADRRDGGTIELDGTELHIHHPRGAVAAGICLLTEDRKHQGLLLGRSVQENFGLASLSHFTRFGLLNVRGESSAFRDYVDRLRIKITSHRQRAATLSGGNQQKVVLARWLERNAEVIIFDEPTRGIDVGAKFEIYELINSLAAQGKCILMISSELPEVLGMADRILVMHEGRITGEITDMENATQEQIMDLAVK